MSGGRGGGGRIIPGTGGSSATDSKTYQPGFNYTLSGNGGGSGGSGGAVHGGSGSGSVTTGAGGNAAGNGNGSTLTLGTPGAGGKAIALNGNIVTYVVQGTIYGAVS